MSRKSLEETNYEAIKAAMQDPERYPLSEYLQYQLDRVVSAAKILDRYPVRRKAVQMLKAKYPGLTQVQAYNDIRLSIRIFNSFHTFDYEFWHDWLINNIVEQIQAAKETGDLKSWAMGNANLLKAIGEKPEKELDPKLTEKHSFYILIQNNKNEATINLDRVNDLPLKARKEITDGLIQEATNEDVTQIMES